MFSFFQLIYFSSLFLLCTCISHKNVYKVSLNYVPKLYDMVLWVKISKTVPISIDRKSLRMLFILCWLKGADKG